MGRTAQASLADQRTYVDSPGPLLGGIRIQCNEAGSQSALGGRWGRTQQYRLLHSSGTWRKRAHQKQVHAPGGMWNGAVPPTPRDPGDGVRSRGADSTARWAATKPYRHAVHSQDKAGCGEALRADDWDGPE